MRASFLLVVCLLASACGGRSPSGGADASPDGAGVDGAADAAPGPDASPGLDAETGPLCAAQGGHCVPGRWASCPVGEEPTADVHADCKPPNASRGHFCCIPAPPSSCSDNEITNCFDTQCHDCWFEGMDPSLTCEAGRVCCAYLCTD